MVNDCNELKRLQRATEMACVLLAFVSTDDISVVAVCISKRIVRGEWISMYNIQKRHVSIQKFHKKQDCQKTITRFITLIAQNFFYSCEHECKTIYQVFRILYRPKKPRDHLIIVLCKSAVRTVLLTGLVPRVVFLSFTSVHATSTSWLDIACTEVNNPRS